MQVTDVIVGKGSGQRATVISRGDCSRMWVIYYLRRNISFLARHTERGGGLSFLAMCTHRERADAGQVGAERRGRCEQAVARGALTSGAGGGAHQWGIPKETAGAGYYVSFDLGACRHLVKRRGERLGRGPNL